MKNLSLPLLFSALSTLSALALGGCAQTAPEAQSAAPTRDVLNRAGAIASAQQDAARTYGPTSVAQADRLGGFWVVELRVPDGAGVHYAISARDGSIRERNTYRR